jgi:hypothetical protein
MKPVHRRSVHKHKSARKFRHGVSHTKALNVRSSPNRGGWRL